MAADAFDGLGDDHAAWLLVVAHNELCQRRPERAATLLELLEVLDPGNLPGRRLRAYAYWLAGDAAEARAVLERVPREEAGPAHAAIERLRTATAGQAQAVRR